MCHSRIEIKAWVSDLASQCRLPLQLLQLGIIVILHAQVLNVTLQKIKNTVLALGQSTTAAAKGMKASKIKTLGKYSIPTIYSHLQGTTSHLHTYHGSRILVYWTPTIN